MLFGSMECPLFPYDTQTTEHVTKKGALGLKKKDYRREWSDQE